MNKRLWIATLALILVATGAYFTYVATNIRTPISLAEKFVLNFSGNKSETEFIDALSNVSTEYFNEVRVSCAWKSYSNNISSGNAVINTIDKVFLVDTEPTTTVAVVYYTELNSRLDSTTPMQASVILRKQDGNWLIDEAYKNERTGEYIPKSASEENRLQLGRVKDISNVLSTMVSNRSTGDLNGFMAAFTDNSIGGLLEDKFINEQTYLNDTGLSLTISDLEVIPLNTTDKFAKCILKYTISYGEVNKEIHSAVDLAVINNTWKVTWLSDVNS